MFRTFSEYCTGGKRFWKERKKKGDRLRHPNNVSTVAKKNGVVLRAEKLSGEGKKEKTLLLPSSASLWKMEREEGGERRVPGRSEG